MDHTPPPLDAVSWPVRTDRLLLRPAAPDDADATWAFRRLPEVGRWITHRPQDRAAYVAHFRDPDRLASTLVVEQSGAVVGDLMLRVGDAWGQGEVVEQTRGVQAELGWVLDPAHGGRGLATEAVTALIGLCFDDLGLRRVTAECFAANEASWRLMERVGMRRETHAVGDSLHRDLGWIDGVGYALLAEEWAVRRAGRAAG